MKRRAHSQLAGSLLDVALYGRRGVRQGGEQIVVSVRPAVLVPHVIHLFAVHGQLRVNRQHVSNHHGLLMHHIRLLQQSLSAPSRYSTTDKYNVH